MIHCRLYTDVLVMYRAEKGGGPLFLKLWGLTERLIRGMGESIHLRSKGHGGRMHEYQFLTSLSTSDVMSTRDPIKGPTVLEPFQF